MSSARCTGGKPVRPDHPPTPPHEGSRSVGVIIKDRVGRSGCVLARTHGNAHISLNI